MKKAGVLLVGASGRMGQQIALALQTHPLLFLENSAGSKTKWRGLSETDKSQVVVDFSLPAGLKKSLEYSVRKKRPYVCGVTGLGSQELALLKEASKKIPVFYAANMSLGIAALKQSLEALGPMTQFDIVIEEIHHNKKRDKPSGTALSLAESIKTSQARSPSEIHAIRGGGVIGTHKVLFMSDKEILSFEHQALDRSLFAEGALTAAVWILKKKAGYYGMSNLLETK